MAAPLVSEPCIRWSLASLDGWSPHRERLRASLSTAEHARATRFATDTLRHRFETGRGLARLWLGALIGCPAAEVPLGASETGRPLLREGPFDFNISHSGDTWAMAVSAHGRVGIDIETAGRAGDPLALAGRFFAPGEIAWLRGLPDRTRRGLGFCKLWTAKESALKAAGCGLAGGLAAADCSGWLADASLPVPAGGSLWSVRPLPAPEGMALALAFPFPPPDTPPPRILEERMEEMMLNPSGHGTAD